MREDADVERRSVTELLAMLTRREPEDVDLVDRAGGLARLACADAFEIAGYLGQGRRRARSDTLRTAWTVAAAFELGRRAEIARGTAKVRVASPGEVAAWAAPRLGGLAHEELWMLGVDGRGHLRAARCVAKGGLHGASLRAADPLRAALRVDAAAFILVHNHPSGDPTPSREDVAMTEDVAAAAAVVGVPLLDHVVVAGRDFTCIPLPDVPPRKGAVRTLTRARDGTAR
jgi:DNA repair protein RadC